MHVVLTPELARRVDEAVADGKFASPEAVVAEALRFLLAPEQSSPKALDGAIQVGIDDADRGEFVSAEELRAELAAVIDRKTGM